MKFSVVVSVRGSVCVEVEADSPKEASQIAEEKVSEMDFNRLENIDWDVVDVWGGRSMKYILVSVLNHDIFVHGFDSYDEARNAMLNELYEEYDFYYDSGNNTDTPDSWEYIRQQPLYSTPDFGFSESHAYSNLIYRCVWQICPVEEIVR